MKGWSKKYCSKGKIKCFKYYEKTMLIISENHQTKIKLIAY